MKKNNILTFVLISLLLALSIMFAYICKTELVFYIFAFFILLFVIKHNILLFNHMKNHYFLLYIALFTVRLTILLYRIYDTQAYFPFQGTDNIYFHFKGIEIATNSNNIIDLIFYDTGLYNKFVGLIYYIYGVNDRFMYIINFIFSELIFFYIYKTSFQVINKKKTAIISSFIFYVYPVSLVYATDFMREMSVELSLIISIYYFIRYLQNNKKLDIIIALIFSLTLCFLHSGYIGVFGCYVIAIAFFNRNKFRFKLTPMRFIIFTVIALIVFTTPVWSMITDRFKDIGSLEDAVDIIANSKLGASNYIQPPNNLIEAILQLPLRLFYYLNAPLPWHIYSFETSLAMIFDGCIRWYIFLKMFFCIKKIRHFSRSDRITLIFFCLIEFSITFVFCWGTNNYGNAMRHRAASLPIEIMIFYVLKNKIKYYNMERGS